MTQADEPSHWPTPTVHDAERGGQAKRAAGPNRHGSNLQDFALIVADPMQPTGERRAGGKETEIGGAREFNGNSSDGFADGSKANGVADSERNGGRSDEPGRRQEGREVSFWSDTDWLDCTDGKARPVESGTFPLAHGISGRMGRLRAYGNAIVPQVAAEFIKACAEALNLSLPDSQ